MNKFTIDALHLARDGKHLSFANDLVRRTLAQHGLMPDEGSDAIRPAAMPGLSAALGAHAPPKAAEPLVPGARFEPARFSCDAGSRDYLTYVPASGTKGISGVVMMLHGCTQTHADFAAGTGMNALAETHGFVVVYPQQSRGDNAQSCWNWFSPGDQRRGCGEPAILAGLAAHVAGLHGVPPEKTFVAGLSAGAAMAVILGQTYGDTFAAVGAHSGLPFAVAKDVPSAFAAMARSAPEGEMRRPACRATRTIVFHGDADRTVNPSNGTWIAADVVRAGPDQTLMQNHSGRRNGRAFARNITRSVDGELLLEHWTVQGLGHAWSGGRAAGSYTDPAGPDASAEMVRFFFRPEEG